MTTDVSLGAEDRLRRRARQYLQTRQLVAAQATLETLLQRAPQDVAARMQLATVLLERGQLRASARQLLAAARELPGDPGLITALARRLYLAGETVAARACLDHPALRQPSAEVLAVLAHLRWMLDEIPASLALMEQAIAAGVDTPDDDYLYAMLLQFTGRGAEAGERLAACLRRWPTFGGAAIAQARLHRQTPASQHLDFLREQLRRIPSDSKVPSDRQVRAEFDFALFKELDDLGRYDEAWPALQEGNAIMHALNPYDAAAESALVDAAMARAVGDVRVAGAAPRVEGPLPIFIIGLPRSGTTLLDRMLSAHGKVVSAGEINDFLRQLRWVADVADEGMAGRLQLARSGADLDVAVLGARYLEQTRWRAHGHAFYIDKLPTNYQFVDLIRRALPQAPILHLVREPMDVCFSSFKAMFGNVSAYSYDLQALAHHHRQYRRLMEHWHRALPGAVLDVPYASLVRAPEATMRQVLAHCGLEWDEACVHPERNAAPVATPSSAQVREAIHDHALGQWRHYATQLEPLRLALT